MSTLTTPSTPSRSDSRPSGSDPAAWWRYLCWILGDRIAVCGDLPQDRTAARHQLREWRRAGVTHILDLREEWTDEAVVARHAPEITYHWLGAHDDGGAQDDTWFDTGVALILTALADPDARIVVHCHMGVNRAPSMAFAALLALDVDPVAALDEIRSARPIANIEYAEDAVAWWQRRTGAPAAAVRDACATVRAWRVDNPCDVGWVISRIRVAERHDG